MEQEARDTVSAPGPGHVPATSGPRVRLLCMSLWLAGGVAIYDFTVYGRAPFLKFPVDVSPPAVARSLIIAVAAFLLVRALRPAETGNNYRDFWGGLDMLRFASPVSTAFIAATAALLLIDPDLLNRLGWEDAILENLSALFLLAAALVTWLAMRNASEQVGVLGLSVPARLPLLGLGALFLLICLEEISWGQRIFGFPTPGLLSGNADGQTNLHNFATFLSEQLYYGAAFCAFVLFPYAASKAGTGVPGSIGFLAPAPGLALIAAPVVFMQSEMWNTVPVQIAAWAAVFILADIVRSTGGALRHWSVCVVAVCITGQTIFLLFTENLAGSNDLTEYKETLIAFLCLTWACAVLNRLR